MVCVSPFFYDQGYGPPLLLPEAQILEPAFLKGKHLLLIPLESLTL